MAHGRAGRLKREELTVTCAGRNHQHKPCGNPPQPGEKYCLHHAPRLDPATTTALVERLRSMAHPALDRLIDIIVHGKDPDANVAIRTLLDRLAPKPGTLNAVILTATGSDTEPQTSPVEEIRRRLDAIRARHQGEITAQPETPSTPGAFDAQPTTDQAADDSGIVDAVLVDEPEPEPIPVARAQVSEPESDVTIVRPAAFGVPAVTSRPFDPKTFGRSGHGHIEPPRWASGA